MYFTISHDFLGKILTESLRMKIFFDAKKSNILCDIFMQYNVRLGARCNNNDPYVSIPLTLSSAPNIMQRYAPARALHAEHTVIFARLRALNTTVA